MEWKEYEASRTTAMIGVRVPKEMKSRIEQVAGDRPIMAWAREALEEKLRQLEPKQARTTGG